jgi:putative tricarboxylic transport membrane protein
MKLANHLSADRIGGLIWVTFGAAVIYGSWVMDQLDSLKIPPATVPGLVPGLLGAGLLIFGLILMMRPVGTIVETSSFAEIAPDATAPESDASEQEFAWNRLSLSWTICMTYGGLLLGRGIHYWILTAAFLLLHFLLLDETDRVPAHPDRSRIILAALLAPVIATVVTLIFQYVFLVRLP